MIRCLFLIILSFGFSSLAEAIGTEAKIFIGSDFHLYPPDFDFDSIHDETERKQTLEMANTNQHRYDNMLRHIKGDPTITSVILNGDVFQAAMLGKNESGKMAILPVTSAMDDERRIELTISALLQAQQITQKQVYFNLGNHDLKAKVEGDKIMMDPDYAKLFAIRFTEALDRQERQSGIRPLLHLVGLNQVGYGDYRSIFDLNIDGVKVKLSHAPFVTTDTIIKQAELFKDSNNRAYSKVTKQMKLESNDSGVFYIFGDSHTPAFDERLKVYNSGSLALDRFVPFKKATFLVLSSDSAQHYTFSSRGMGKIVPYKVPGSGIMSCLSFYK